MNCSATLTAIAGTCAKVLGGVAKVWVVNRDKVSITVSEGAITSVALTAQNPAPGDGLIEYVFKRGSANATIAGNTDDNGRNNSFTTTLHCDFSRQETAKRVALQAIVETDAYCFYQDNNHKIWCLGYDAPVAANVTGDSGTAMTDSNIYGLDIQDTSLELPYEVTMTEQAWEAILDENIE